ncbi:AEC family transporter [Microbacterium sp. p3-SID336]|uniref:AEC family transporter n=1 Tax=Microbacterium sp. p3-SID336 TaxID=2916212 RepID=UPI0021A91E14|nr:AEC family transporter [Microbacterium sp. p3-SID336]MCT1479099.1 AEC family transporter [Microbacterium sp. p3-SID336]
MAEVLSGFVVIAAIALVGLITARIGVLGDTATAVLSKLTMTIGLPALVFTVVSRSHLSDIFSVTGLVAAISGIMMMAVFALAGSFARWGAASTTIGSLASGLVNSTNLGVPISTYLFGDVTAVTAIMLFQLSILTPIALTLLDFMTGRGDRSRPWRMLLVPVRNPVTVTALVAIAFNLLGIHLPPLAMAPVELLGQLSVPVMLLLFGMSLMQAKVRVPRPDRLPVALSITLKSLVQPAVAYVLARWVFHLEDSVVFVCVACAALPTAQNVVVCATRYNVGLNIARTSAIVTTVLTIPLLLAAVALLT